MRIAAISMIGPSPEHEALYEEAKASVEGLVDGFVTHYPQEVHDFAGQRNSLLATAAATGYDWALMLDTDERIQIGHSSLVRQHLDETTADVIMIRQRDGFYEKERFFRLPARGEYRGPTHEAWITDDGAQRTTWHGMTFTEEPKTPEQYRAKVERDREILEAYTKEHPDDPRWWYYLGDTYVGLGETRQAEDAFLQCWIRNGWDEESAWAAYRAGQLVYEEGDYASALNWALNALMRRADLPEACWLAGLCRYYQGHYGDAFVWGQLARHQAIGWKEIPPGSGSATRLSGGGSTTFSGGPAMRSVSPLIVTSSFGCVTSIASTRLRGSRSSQALSSSRP